MVDQSRHLSAVPVVIFHGDVTVLLLLFQISYIIQTFLFFVVAIIFT
jgi:hypothetical protein